MPKGLKAGGRQKGTKNKSIPDLNKITREVMIKIAGDIIDDPEMLTPLEFLLAVQNNPDYALNIRIDAAKSASPYIHQRLPQQVEHTGKEGGQIEIAYADARNQLEHFLLEGEYETIETIEEIKDE